METPKSIEVFNQNRILNLTKNELTEFAKSVVNQVAEGTEDAMQTLITSKKVIEIFTAIEKNVRPYASNQVIQKGGLTLYNATIIEKNSPSKYDYSVCKDSTYDALIKEREALDIKIKEREAFLKAIPAEGVATLEGEVVLPPDVTHGKMSLQVTLK